MNSINVLQWKILDSQLGTANVKVIDDKNFTFDYPCTNYTNCTGYEVIFSPGTYEISMYGASGGGITTKELVLVRGQPNLTFACINHTHDSNIDCFAQYSASGAGGYVSGIITFKTHTKGYIHIGGKGIESPKVEYAISSGGYNGGGASQTSHAKNSAFSGGGSTDLRILKNDIYHRILVSGGGGGSDDQGPNDGRGGAGGGLTAQGPQLVGRDFDPDLVANQTKGDDNKFYYGLGGGDNNTEDAGAGGGWYGGYSMHHDGAGAGGGSSFALGEDPDFDSFEADYAFKNHEYSFTNVIHERGVRGGHGQVNISFIKPYYPMTRPLQSRYSLHEKVSKIKLR